MTFKRYCKDEEELVVPFEFADVTKILESGAKKYGTNSWLKGEHFNHRDNHASMCRHLAEAYVGKTRDDESGEHPLLHLATRALMEYTLYCRNVPKIDVRIDDEELQDLYNSEVMGH